MPTYMDILKVFMVVNRLNGVGGVAASMAFDCVVVASRRSFEPNRAAVARRHILWSVYSYVYVQLLDS